MKSMLLRTPRLSLTPGRCLPAKSFSVGFLAVALALPTLNALASPGTVTFANHSSWPRARAGTRMPPRPRRSRRAARRREPSS